MKRADPAKAIAYLRVSTEEQQLGPEAQRAAIERWAAGAQVAILEVHEDKIGGAVAASQRPGLVAALAALRAHEAGVLIVARRDRLARDVLVVAQVEQLVAKAGARIASADGVGAGDSPESALLRRMIDGFAEYERALIKIRTRQALMVRRSRGERYSGHPPIGEQLKDGRLLPNEHEASAVARAFELRAAGGTHAAIARRLTAEGFRPRGARWHRTTITRLLQRTRG